MGIGETDREFLPLIWRYSRFLNARGYPARGVKSTLMAGRNVRPLTKE